jgi:isopentenyl phosphate kinase
MKLLKLGGSVVTKKAERLKINTENIRRLTQEIKKTLPQKIVLIHGGGSFGHPIAKKYNINEGYKSPRQLIGFSKTHQAMVSLNSKIVKELNDAGIPAFGVSPSSYITTENRRIKKFDVRILEELVNLGLIPVLYGDAVIDEKQGFAILSGDQLAVVTAKKLKAKRLIFGTDINGIYTTDPKLDPKAKLLDKISISEIDEGLKIRGSLNTDVTGGMLGKIREASEAARSGIEVLIVNALEPEIIRNALLGEKVKGTYLIP